MSEGVGAPVGTPGGAAGSNAFDATAAAASSAERQGGRMGAAHQGPAGVGGRTGPSALHSRMMGDENGLGSRMSSGMRGSYGGYGGYGGYSGSSYGGYGGGMYGGGYGGSGYGYGRPGYGSGMYGGGYGGGSGGGYGGFGGGYGGYSGAGGAFGPGRLGMIENVLGQGGEVVNGVQNSFQSVMHTVARVSGLLEELMRNFHMIFESVFGLIYSISAFREEMGAQMPDLGKGFWRRILVPLAKRISILWRIAALFAAAPFTHRFSPVRFLLRIFGLTPPPPLEADEFGAEADTAGAGDIEPSTFASEGGDRGEPGDVELPNL